MSSLQERVNARLEQLKQERTFVIPVDGLEDELAARYRVLLYEESWDLLSRYQGEEDTPETTLASNADLLIAGCLDLLEVKDDGSFQSLGCRWNSDAQVLREKTGVNVPDGATAREAVFAVFAGPEGPSRLSRHADAYGFEARKGVPRVTEAILGESEAPSTGA